MVLATLRINQTQQVSENNPFYGKVNETTTFERTITCEKCDGVVFPENGIRIVFPFDDIHTLEVIIGRFYFTGEREEDCDKDTIFGVSYSYEECTYEVNVNQKGELVSLGEWLVNGEYEDGAEPDNYYSKDDERIQWELVSC